jgi:trans-aconitate 2-methyltransferase
MSYLFKDTGLAARRLQILADVFAPASRAFLQDIVCTVPQVAVDLGCGPGYTTLLLAEVTQCVQAIGLDKSEHFLALAQRHATAQIAFLQHDISQIPFPVGSGDLLSCRFLLTHLTDPPSIIERWLTQLRPGGSLLVEEVEGIQTTNSTFRSYLEIVAAMLEQQANQLYIGSFLDQYPLGAGIRWRMSRVYRLPVSTQKAAAMFHPNIQTWKDHPFIQAHYAGSKIEQIEQDLQELVETSTSEGEIVWGLRQLVFERQ